MNRRDFLKTSALLGTGLVSVRRAAAEPPPEITRLKLLQSGSACQGPIHVAEDLLRLEGFTDVQYVRPASLRDAAKMIGAGEVDMGLQFAAPFLMDVDQRAELVTLGGVHGGCFVLFGNRAIRGVRDLKGKTVSVPQIEGRNPARVYIATMAAYVGLDPARDITWRTDPVEDATRRFAEGKIDAIMGFPPLAQELRARGIGHVVVDSTNDRPWSQYFCCMVVVARDFSRKHPVAAKRMMRAILKANAICTRDPERVARLLVDKGVTKQYDYALQTVKEMPYGRWREFDAEDTMRFYALRLHEAGLVKSSPQRIIGQGADLRFVSELKKELKG